jgi:hypothetical protein
VVTSRTNPTFSPFFLKQRQTLGDLSHGYQPRSISRQKAKEVSGLFKHLPNSTLVKLETFCTLDNDSNEGSVNFSLWTLTQLQNRAVGFPFEFFDHNNQFTSVHIGSVLQKCNRYFETPCSRLNGTMLTENAWQTQWLREWQ